MFEDGYVLLGLGDADADRALEWAAREASSLSTDLRILRAVHWSTHLAPWDSIADCAVSTEYRGAVEARLRTALRYVHLRYPEVVVHCEAVDSFPSRALLDRSRNAAMTVLGSRSVHADGGTALGSLSAQIATQSQRPVVLVRGSTERVSAHRAVVVGVDDSPIIDDVLSFAFDHADRHSRSLHAVFCWAADRLVESHRRPAPRPSARAEQWLADCLTRWSEKYPDVAVERTVLRTRPVAGLVAAALGADLLVVGSRSRHAKASALGSVSLGVAHHAPCPVAIVH